MGETNNIECKMTFEVPDGYFDTLADNVMQRIDFEDRQRKDRRVKFMRACGLMAAVVAGIAIFLNVGRTEPTFSDSPQQMFSQQYVTIMSQQYSDITVIDFINQNTNESEAEINEAASEYDIELLSMYASPVNFMY
ncbi:MAG: hypothetical protein J6T60_12700 [Bacteroidales bacterium]|nr:hypothetical protein [Bacteroidales bacterium]